jgi:hypothetical protein
MTNLDILDRERRQADVWIERSRAEDAIRNAQNDRYKRKVELARVAVVGGVITLLCAGLIVLVAL